MPKQLIEVGGKPLLDIASYGRRGPGRRDHLSPAEIEIIARTVNRTPEVMVKVLTRGGQSLAAVRAHLDYLNRRGELDIETDTGERLAGKGVAKQLLEDWDMDVEAHRRRSELRPGRDRSPPKLVHKVLFSMPPGTPPEKVLAAVKNFAREEFGLKQRYAMVLHSDEPHPHVHMVVKAVSERGVRINIHRATLRHWRSEFARHLRELGVAANATERAVRGASNPNWKDGVYRAARRAESTFMLERSESIAQEPRDRVLRPEVNKSGILRTRSAVQHGWQALAQVAVRDGIHDLANQVIRFLERMPPALTDREWITQRLESYRRETVLPIR